MTVSSLPPAWAFFYSILEPEKRTPRPGGEAERWWTTTRKRALEHTRCPAINRKKNPPELSVRFCVHGVARMEAMEARLATGGGRVATGRARTRRSIDASIGVLARCRAVTTAVHYQNVTTSAVHATTPDRAAHREPYRGLLIIRFFLAILPPLVFPIDFRTACFVQPPLQLP